MVISVLLILIVKCQNIEPIGHKISFKEPVHDKHLENDVHKAQEFTGPVAKCIGVVFLQNVKSKGYSNLIRIYWIHLLASYWFPYIHMLR